ncbi:hypothetical protein K438DRAFT_1980480 [Mycena galopus ATCC 62051]|nr:hypothetical protein K438DRAFT_1980480 [Mycena galopus ATCC 62051]
MTLKKTDYGLPTTANGLKKKDNAERLVTKRAQWKAASARYYERHPEVKEKKRLKAAELRAAKKLAKRRWDPPRQSLVALKEMSGDEPLRPPPDAPTGTTREDSKAGTVEPVRSPLHPVRAAGQNVDAHCGLDAAESFSGLQAMCGPPHADAADKWSRLAPQYDSSDED